MLIYNLLIFFYRLSISLSSFFSRKAKLWIEGRKNLLPTIYKATKNEQKDIIWIHTASLGEFEQGRPLIEYIKKNYLEKKIFLSFFSPSGYHVRKNYQNVDYIFYLPLDTKKNARLFIQYIKPKLVLFVKYEFWHHYLFQLKKAKIPTYLISANFRYNQLFFKPYGGFYRKILRNFSHIFVQNVTSKNLLQSIGFNEVTVVGDTRFDTVFQTAKNIINIPSIERFRQDKKLLICGSTWWSDEKNIIRWINETALDIKCIIAPHEICNTHIQRITAKLKKEYILLSKLKKTADYKATILIVDTIGLLSSLYNYGNVAYIGGGFGKGIHNILEAAIFGLPIIFGPRHQKFKEAKDLLSRKAAFSYNNYTDLKSILQKFFNNHKVCKNAGNRAKNYVMENIGSTKKIKKKLNILFS